MWKRKLTSETQKKWDEFIYKFTPEYVRNKMTIDEYVVGKGKENKSFCYIIERELDDLGGIRGATSTKFGIYWSQKENRYITAKTKYGENVDEAFLEIKEELASLIERTTKLTKFVDLKSKISGMFKYKIMYLYNPEIMIPCFYDEDLGYFISRLGIKSESGYEKHQQALLEYRSNYYPDQSNYSFGVILYSDFGRLINDKDKKANKYADDKLNDSDNIVTKNISYEPYIPSPVEKGKLIKTKEGSYYRRDSKVAAKALYYANYKCENNPSHALFERRRNNTTYTEVHHLVPMAYQDDFSVSLDVPANIVSLCANCHREIHFGKDSDKIIKRLYLARKELLKAAGIEIDLADLIKMYENLR